LLARVSASVLDHLQVDLNFCAQRMLSHMMRTKNYEIPEDGQELRSKHLWAKINNKNTV